MSSLENYTIRVNFTRFRLGCHGLYSDLFRQTKNQKYSSFCPVCKENQLEDEFHLLMICNGYKNLRSELLYDADGTLYYFNKLMSSSDKSVVHRTGRFINDAMVRRKNIVENT